jgi:multicomponent Na+:H+ antiporter subunit F
MNEASSTIFGLYQILELVLLLNLVAGLARMLRGPTRFDRMIAAQFFGTVGVGVLVLLRKTTPQPALLDVALVLAILAPVATVAFVRAHESREAPEP